MQFKSIIATAMVASALVLANAAAAQVGEPGGAPPAPTRSAAIGPQAVSARTGTFVFKITLVKKSAGIPSDVLPACFASVYHWTDTRYHVEQGAIVAAGSSVTKTCTITLPYSWPNADTAYTISPRVWVQLSKDNYPTTVPARYVVQDLGPVPLPANGITTFTKTLFY